MEESKPTSSVIEENLRLSQSSIWQLQRKFFEQFGPNAWSKQIVPYQITNNAYIAQAYARVIFGWLRDIAATIKPSQAVYIVELGAGSGRLAYHFLTAFFEFFDKSLFADIPISYVITDFTQATVDFWQNHPQLQSWIQSGRLDFALFDGENDDSFVLLYSGKTLSQETVINPMAVIANYFFDGLIQDMFSVENGQLKESLVTLKIAEANPDLNDMSQLEQVEIKSEQYDIDPDYYEDPVFNQILEIYNQTIVQTHLLFPLGALVCLRNLLEISNGQLFLLSADKGYHREADLLYRDKPALALHGSFSMMVNYHAIGQYTQLRGGQFLSPPYQPGNLTICAAVFGEDSQDYVETEQAYDLEIVQRSPDDFFKLNKDIEAYYQNMSLESLLVQLRLNYWDSHIFILYCSTILEKMENSPSKQREEWYQAIQAIWSKYYFIGEDVDVPFALARLLIELSYYTKALEYLDYSLRLHGADVRTFYNIALCHYELRQFSEAFDYVNQALKVDSQFELAQALAIQIQSELRRNH